MTICRRGRWTRTGAENHFTGATFSPGARIRFKRGEKWREELVPPSSGSARGGHIVFGAYGPSILNRPIIMGADLITDWTLDSGNVWKNSFDWNLNELNVGVGLGLRLFLPIGAIKFQLTRF